jgi:hypothetical protein
VVVKGVMGMTHENRRLRPGSALLLALLLLPGGLGAAGAPPAVPDGYERGSCPAVDGDLPIPKGWVLRTDHRTEGRSESVTCWVAEDPDPEAPHRFRTGITIRRRHGLTAGGLGPQEYAARMIERLMDGREVLDRVSRQRGTLAVDRVEVVDRSTEEPRHTWAFFAADLRAGTLSIVVLEAPESEWEESRKTMEPVLRSIRIGGGE